jgi:hypothetical protein
MASGNVEGEETLQAYKVATVMSGASDPKDVASVSSRQSSRKGGVKKRLAASSNKPPAKSDDLAGRPQDS